MSGIAGDLPEYGFDLWRAVESQAMVREGDAIPRANCWRPHGRFMPDSSKFSALAQLGRVRGGDYRAEPYLSRRRLNRIAGGAGCSFRFTPRSADCP